MTTVRKNIDRMIETVVSNRRSLTNNTQRVLVKLLTAENEDGWVSRTSMRVPSATRRLRDLRLEEFGGFVVECKSVGTQGRRHQTFYRVRPESVTLSALRKIFKEVI